MSFESLVWGENMAVRASGRGGDGKEETRKRGNGERTEATRRGLICRRDISLIFLCVSGSQTVNMWSSQILDATPVP